ncbi:chorismate mutase [Pararoseomonas indoligenes]|uniref:chorismate mutase n=1 Tax=Roseomonas indoligenes TaxID=2820811 RepID=A0A940N018_9PROT|nr:chorismate mutase [Pararoseomonas indoligenes]MBP0494282.1 chorismate mutase [Pararoseomonas indoligenes]
MPDSALTDPAAVQPEALAAARAEFDAIDDQLHDLLMRRAGLSAGLAAQGMKASGASFRPGREAMILRRLLGRHRGPMPRAAIARLWREVIATSLRQQSAFSVAALGGTEHLALGHFGLDTPMRTHATPSRVLAALSAGEATVAILPSPADGEPLADAWWASVEAPRLQVVAALPFLLRAGQTLPSALVVAGFAADATPKDRGLIRLERAPNTSRGALVSALAAAGLPPLRVILSADGMRGLAEVEGLIQPGDPRLASLSALRPHPIGGFAEPSLDEPPLETL